MGSCQRWYLSRHSRTQVT